MSEIISYGWLTDFNDKKFAPKSLFDYIYASTTDGRTLTQYFSDFATELNNRDLQVNLASDNSVKFSSPGAIGVTGILDVPNGGTGQSGFTANSILLGNGQSQLKSLASTAGFFVSAKNGDAPQYSAISALWESLNPDTQGPGFYIGFSSGDKRYYMGEVPLAASNQAGAVSTGTQEINGSKTFLSKTYFSSDIDIAAKATIKDDLTITSGNLVFGNGTSILGQSYTDKFFINDNNDKTIFYADATGLHAVEFYIKNNVTGEDTNFSAALGRITALEGRSTNIESDLAQEVANRKNSVLYVALGTASTTKKIQDTAIGVDGVLNVTNGGTGLNSLTKNSILLGNDTSAVSLIGAAQGFLVCNSTSNQPHYAGISALWESTNPTTQGPTLYISFDSNNTKQYKMDEVPLASKNYAGTISTGAQEINGSKTFLSNAQFDGNITVVGTAAFTSKATFSSDIDVTGSAKVNNDLTIQTGNLVFGNNSCILGQSFTDSFFINDANDNTIFYADSNGLHAVEYWIKNANYDTNFSTTLGRIRDLESKTAETEADLTQEIADRKNSVLYVSLDTSSKTKTLQDSSIGVDGILPIVHGGTGNSLGYILTGLKSGTTSGTCATAEGKNVTASGLYSHGEGLNTSATGNYSHA
jgi:hypothetical protein